MSELFAVALILLCAVGTWRLSKFLHPGVLIVVGVLIYGLGSWTVLALHGGDFFFLLQILGTIVVVHGIVLWVRRARVTRQQAAGTLRLTRGG